MANGLDGKCGHRIKADGRLTLNIPLGVHAFLLAKSSLIQVKWEYVSASSNLLYLMIFCKSHFQYIHCKDKDQIVLVEFELSLSLSLSLSHALVGDARPAFSA